MSIWSEFFYFSVVTAALLLSVLGLWFSSIIPLISRWSRRFFRGYFLSFILCCVCVLIEWILPFSHGPREAVYFMSILESLLLSIPLPMVTVYLLHCSGKTIFSSKLFRTVLILWAVYCFLLVVAPFLGLFSYEAQDNQYSRGPWYPLLLLPLIAIQLLTLAGLVRHRKELSRKVFFSFLIAILPMTVALFVQLFADVFPLIDISYVLSALSMYGLILSDQIDQDRRHQQEIARQQQEIARQQQEIAHERASVMVLQMRPHFIYNTLMSIYSLCNLDPQKARQVTMDFTNYLRKNFHAVASDSPIPFSAELEHTRAYLAVEQVQYEDMLFVEYDTAFTHFRLPPLTLQPIVENAVKHGMDPYAGSFHISIRTQKTDSGSEIIVTDDGRGFTPADDSDPGIALKNIRQRLMIMCGGCLAISSQEGSGTTVTVTIPESAPSEKSPLIP